MRRLVIWAHSECRSNAALFAAVKQLAEARGIEVALCLWDMQPLAESRKVHALGYLRVGNDLSRGRDVLRRFGGAGSVHVFCVYQNSAVWRELIVEAKASGARVVVNAEAPCEMCVGPKAVLKRLYYRWILPCRVRRAVRAADLFLSASGEAGRDRLLRLGWTADKIVPFGYASPRLMAADDARALGRAGAEAPRERLRVLHLGSEAAYRGVSVAERAARMAGVELVKTGGAMAVVELVREIRAADLVVACGFCEPWGMRVNDALLEGVPVIVSDGMGVSWAVANYACGCVVPKGDVTALADVFRRCAADSAYLAELRRGAREAAAELLPERRAGEWLREVMGR